MSELQDEETRIARMMVTGSISEEAYKQLRAEWQEKKVNVQCKIDDLQFDARKYLDNLKVALTLMTSMSKLFERLDEKQKTKLLLIITKRIIINPQGVIVDQELHSPFSYLFTLAALIKGYREEECGSELVRLGSPETSFICGLYFICL